MIITEEHKATWKPLGTTAAGKVVFPTQAYYADWMLKTPAPRVAGKIAKEQTRSSAKRNGKGTSTATIKNLAINLLKNAGCKSTVDDELEIRHPNAGVCCGGSVFHRRSGNACCADKPYFKRKQLCCGAAIVDRRKERNQIEFF